MPLADVLPDEELLALLVSNDEKIEKADCLKRVQLLSLCRAQAKALAYFRYTTRTSSQPEASNGPIILQVNVSDATGVGGIVSDDYGASAISFSEKGVGDAPVLASTRSISSQQQAELGVAAGPGIAGAAYSGVDERVLEVLGQLTSRLEKIEASIEFQKAGGKKDHGYRECPYGGKNAAGTAAYCMPADAQGADEDMRTLALCQIFQVAAADDGSDAFAAAVAEYGAPAVLAGGESDEIDVSAYGFTVADSSSGVLSELEALTGQVRAMEERVGGRASLTASQVSLVEGEDVIEHRTDAPSG
ncbi:hypothetical protein CYMTET_26145 [Cymbomonas tetramitiformis]|uniref:Uncharacterized protein n=1 Tax=Cymbomonas tetramitiformis TaxID=36881 RepID=A0AAE0FSV0_9CHLO|nr:hypothetical protein CYMTET_26145 [Cymbomonas tetramitiformis]